VHASLKHEHVVQLSGAFQACGTSLLLGDAGWGQGGGGKIEVCVEEGGQGRCQTGGVRPLWQPSWR
jgi:hypothetical protein